MTEPACLSHSDRLAAWFSQARLDHQRATIEAFWAGRGRYVVSISTGKHSYRQCRDLSHVRPRALANLEAQAAVPGLNVPCFSADFGTISLPRYWGGTMHWPPDTCPYVDPVAADVDAALSLAPRPVDDPAMDAARGVELYQQICADLGTDQLAYRTVDMQGPMNIAAMVVNQEELMMTMVDEPQKVDAMLERTTDFFIKVAQFQQASVGPRIAGNLWPYLTLPAARGLAFTEDIMPLVSAPTYHRFALPYLRRLSEQFDGLMIHCCGEWGRHVHTLADAQVHLLGVEFHYPFTRMDELLPLADQAVFVPYLAIDKQHDFPDTSTYYRHLLDQYGHRCRFWFAWPDDTDEARAFHKEFGDTG